MEKRNRVAREMTKQQNKLCGVLRETEIVVFVFFQVLGFSLLSFVSLFLGDGIYYLITSVHSLNENMATNFKLLKHKQDYLYITITIFRIWMSLYNKLE